MRKLLCLLALAALVGFGCQPKVLIFTVTPSVTAAGPAKVKIYWKLSAGTGELSANQPVVPKLDPKKPVDKEGEIEVEVCETTTFKLEPHYGGESTAKVIVNKACSPVTCGPQTLTFTGTCESASQGPTYIIQNTSTPGKLANLSADVDYPIHVTHNGVLIELGASGTPLGPIPDMLAAGDYTISIPGASGQKICADATSPVGGGTAEGPVIHLTVVPLCP